MSNLEKIDPDLLALLSESGQGSEELKSAKPKVHLFVITKENLESLRSLGFELQMSFGNIGGLKVSLEEIEKIAALSDVVRIEASKSGQNFMLDKSTKEVRANFIRVISGNTWSGIATGKGVITAIIDSGLNYQHRSFRNADGTTRIIRILDFSLDGTTPHPDGGTTPNITVQFGADSVLINEGVQYLQNNIRDALAPGGQKLRHKDTNGHGTHVTGIAAGNGLQRDNCGGFYPGVAPEADILVVKLGTNNIEHQVLLGVAYSIQIAIDEGKGVVINLSSSRDTAGAHDGSSTLERLIDLMLDNHQSNKNVSLVTIAGNTAHQETHATGNVPANSSLTVNFQVSKNTQTKVIEIWYSGAGNNQLGITLRPPPPLTDTGEVLPQPTPARLPFNLSGGARAEIGSSLQPNNFQNILIAILPPGLNGFPAEVFEQPWRLELRNLAPAGGQAIEFHAWGFTQEGQVPSVMLVHVSPRTRDSTVGIPGTARNVITVGSFDIGDGRLSFRVAGQPSTIVKNLTSRRREKGSLPLIVIFRAVADGSGANAATIFTLTMTERARLLLTSPERLR